MNTIIAGERGLFRLADRGVWSGLSGLDVCIIQKIITSIVVGSLPVKFPFLLSVRKRGICIRMWISSNVFDLRKISTENNQG